MDADKLIELRGRFDKDTNDTMALLLDTLIEATTPPEAEPNSDAPVIITPNP